VDPGLNRAFAAAAVTTFCLGGALFGAMLIMPLYYQVVRGEGALTTGLLLAPQGVGAAFAMFLSGRLSDRVGGGPVAVLGVTITAVARATRWSSSRSRTTGCSAACSITTGWRRDAWPPPRTSRRPRRRRCSTCWRNAAWWCASATRSTAASSSPRSPRRAVGSRQSVAPSSVRCGREVLGDLSEDDLAVGVDVLERMAHVLEVAERKAGAPAPA